MQEYFDSLKKKHILVKSRNFDSQYTSTISCPLGITLVAQAPSAEL